MERSKPKKISKGRCFANFTSSIYDCAKDSGEEFFTKMDCAGITNL